MTEPNDSQITQIMKNAHLDLAGNVSGKFSPADWEKILGEARRRVAGHMSGVAGAPPLEVSAAWAEVMREFHRENHWGYAANFKKPKVSRPKNLGIDLIWLTFQSMTATKVAILWAGEGYSNGDGAIYKWIFFALMVYIPGNALYFIWRYRKHT